MNLFIVCPFSQAEQYIRKHLDPNGLFLTANGALVNWDEGNEEDNLLTILQKYPIEDLFLVQHTSSPFASQVMHSDFDTHFKVMADLVKYLLPHKEKIRQAPDPQLELFRTILQLELNRAQSNRLVKQQLASIRANLNGLLIHNQQHQLINQ
jgi:hypothetical protein